MKEEYQDLIRDIESNSPYKRTPSPQKKWMSVTEMGALLGLKKTDRYWLLHKNVFESREIAGKLRVNIASFEKWYANQVKYQKVTGEEPGLELKKWSYSVCDIAQLLEIEESDSYFVIVTRENLYHLPYSTDEIYGLRCSGRYRDTKRMYQQMYRLVPAET